MHRKKSSRVIIVLGLLVLFISLGYAALTSNLNIIGTSKINNPSWDVHWNNVQVTNGSVTGTQVTTPAHIKTGATEVEFSITLSTPGDYYEFTVDAVNAGTIDAMIGNLSGELYESDGVTPRQFPSYLNFSIGYSDGNPVGLNDVLAAGLMDTYKVKLEFSKDVEEDELPTNPDTIIFTLGIEYIQADDNGEPRPITGYVYRSNSMNGNLDANISTIGPTYTTYQEATTEYNIFLRHRAENDIIKDTSLGFILNGNPYYLINAYDTASVEANKTTLKNAFGESNCTEDNNVFSCTDSSLTAEIYPTSINAVDPTWQCFVDANGFSSCISGNY